jgi:glycosyltransferase involved in cell wall biosynthesis
MNRPLRLVYIIGRYPELTTTFIEREIRTLRHLGDIEIQPVSIRYPLTPSSVSPDLENIREDTLYLIPKSLLAFNFLAFVFGNIRFVLLRPCAYFGTLIYLLTHCHPNLKARLVTILHFWQGIYAAHVLRKRDFDHMHAHFMDRAVVVALVVSRLLKKPYSFTAHANDIYTKRILIREKMSHAKFIVTVSQYNRDHLLKNYPGLEKTKIHVLHPWVDPSHYTPPPTKPSFERLHILFVGRLVEKKGPGYLVEACRLLRKHGVDFECRLVGAGPLRPELEKKIAQFGLQNWVHLMGGQPQSEVLRLLGSWANIFVLACVIAEDGDRDGIPVSLAEAMAMEIPIVSTDVVGFRELVKPGTGILVPPRDPLALAEALQTIHTADLSSRIEMGRRGRAVVEAEFNLLEGTRRLAGLFRESVA